MTKTNGTRNQRRSDAITRIDDTIRLSLRRVPEG